MDLPALNWIAIVVAALAAFGLGAVWYGPLFGKPWQRLSGLSDDDLAGSNMALTYSMAFLLQFVAVTGLAFLIPPSASLVDGLLRGLSVGAIWISTALGVTYLFSMKPRALALIDIGYHVAYYALAGALLGAF